MSMKNSSDTIRNRPWRWLEKIKHWSLPKQRSLKLLQNLLMTSRRLHEPCLVVAPRCSSHSKFSNTLVPNSVSLTPTVTFQTVMALPLGSGPGSLAPSRGLCFRIWKNLHYRAYRFACLEWCAESGVKRCKSGYYCVWLWTVNCRLSLPVGCVTQKLADSLLCPRPQFRRELVRYTSRRLVKYTVTWAYVRWTCRVSLDVGWR
jgi:hypothetical protein